MSINPTLFQHGYRVPIPRSPQIDFAAQLQENIPQSTEEEIPSKYFYMEMMGAQRNELKELFIRNCNHARWLHIRNAKVKAKK